MSTYLDGRELSAKEFLELMRSEELAGNSEYDRMRKQGLVLRDGIWMTRETAQELEAA